ncbi:MAG: pitrilysin family protein [Myxococcota bacterium]|nr:pitrilysin family protein [Myxococcota bacterium]
MNRPMDTLIGPLAVVLGLMVTLPDHVRAEKPDRSQLPGPSGTTVWTPPKVQTWTMKNGINVMFLEARQAPLITLKFITAQGSATDTPEKAGLAAFMVDMMDEGAGDRDALALSDALQLLATDYSGSAGVDGLSFSINMLADKLDDSLALLMDILRKPTFPAKEFERRKAQRLASALTSEADPSSGASVVRKRVLFGQGYGAFPNSGVRHTIEKIGLQDIKDRYAALVQPGGATIVVVGDIKKARLETALTKAFGDWIGVPKASPMAVKKRTTTGGVHVVDFPGSAQSVVMMSRVVAGTMAPDYFECLVFNRPFSGSFTSRVNLNLREEKGYTYGARGMFSRLKRVGSFTIYAKVKRDTTRASLDEMIAELTQVRGQKPLTEKEIAEAVGGLIKSFPGRFERMSSVAGQLGRLVLDGYGADWYREWPKHVQAVTRKQANEAAKSYSAPGEFAIIVAGDMAKIGQTLVGLKRPIHRYDAQGNYLGKGLPAPAQTSEK